MAAPRKYPPVGAAADIERLAEKGYSTIGLAKFFNVSRSLITRWLEEDEKLEDCYEQGRDSYRQALEEQIIAMTMANKNPAGLIYLLKAKFKMYDQPSSKLTVDASVNTVQSVLVVHKHGTDEQWAAKCAAQQRALTADSSPREIETVAIPAQVEIEALHEAPATLAPSWMPPVAVAQSYAPPGYDWQAQPAPGPIYAPELTQSAPVAPSWPAEWRQRV